MYFNEVNAMKRVGRWLWRSWGSFPAMCFCSTRLSWTPVLWRLGCSWARSAGAGRPRRTRCAGAGGWTWRTGFPWQKSLIMAGCSKIPQVTPQPPGTIGCDQPGCKGRSLWMAFFKYCPSFLLECRKGSPTRQRWKAGSWFPPLLFFFCFS